MSLDKILEKPCVHSNAQIFSPIAKKPDQNAVPDDVSTETAFHVSCTENVYYCRVDLHEEYTQSFQRFDLVT